MKIWIDRFLAGLRWGWGHFAHVCKMIFAKLRVWLSVIVDPPARTRLFYLLVGAALISLGWTSYAFVNSWLYKPTIQALAEFSYVLSGDDGDVALPEMEPVSPVAVTSLPPVEVTEVVCHDMSDTPQCEPVQENAEKRSQGIQNDAEVNQPPAKKAIAYKPRKKAKAYKIRKHQPFETYWGF